MAGDNVSAQQNISVSKKLLRLLQEHLGGESRQNQVDFLHHPS